ncbi:MAG TPA: M14 family metallopeptidase, partial [Bacillota bacterium]|nr:M14 family metallopeptidase [Bacillota bacterium]
MKTVYQPDKYYRYDEIVALLNSYHAEFPQLTKLYSIGKTYEGREIWLLEITNAATGQGEEKPGYYIDANFHAGEVTGSAVVLYTINHLLANYGSDPMITDVVNSKVIYFIPRVSADGSDLYLTTPFMLRSSTRLYPFEDDQDGVHGEDIDGDGRILQMRIPDENGDFKVSQHDPRLMVKRGPNDLTGTFYRVFTEGNVKNFDGVELVQPRPRWGLDINRNFPANWDVDSRQIGAGPFPLSEPETRAVAEFVTSRKNLAGAQSYHTTGGVHLRPFCTKEDAKLPAKDREAYLAIGEKGKEYTGYRHVSVFEGFTADKSKPMRGIYMDWLYEHRGLLSWSTELWDIVGRSGIEVKSSTAELNKTDKEKEDDQLKILQWNDRELDGKGFINWYAFNHPQLGDIEIGGWDVKFVRQNPPHKFLEEECHKNMMFTFVHINALPQLALLKVECEQMEQGVYKVSAAAVNRGYLPTSGSELAAQCGFVKPVVAKLCGAEVVTKAKLELGQ